MPHFLACPDRSRPDAPSPASPKREAFAASPKRAVAETAAPFAAEFAAPRRVVFVVRGRPGPTDRPALPPGSPESWGAITENTVLHQAAYPFPVFPPCR